MYEYFDYLHALSLRKVSNTYGWSIASIVMAEINASICTQLELETYSVY